MTALAAFSGEIKRLALAQGFDLAGIAGVDAAPELARFSPWIEAGKHGEMRYLETRNEDGELKRAALQNAAPWAKSVIVCAMNYNSAAPYSTHAGSTREGWIARYACGETDYHDVLLPRLRKLETAAAELAKQCTAEPFRSWCYVDTGPVVERVAAKYAGIGWIGKNTCILNEKLGSWLFLGVMLTNLELEADLPPADRCGSCTRCLDACPTNAFTAAHELDATRCISYLTIEKKESIPEGLRPLMGRHIFGCDICQDVCPWNRRAPESSELAARRDYVNPALDWLAEMDVGRFREAFRHSPVKRTKLRGLKRNVAIAIGNSGDSSLLAQAERLAHDEDPMVAEHGRWAVERLRELGGKND
ncbi:MAG TPA: tRNA epoxyqueuosine(34) reductase QueG [Candidatus Koribacter sp.]|jgi:epoxyqueuosine reductase